MQMTKQESVTGGICFIIRHLPIVLLVLIASTGCCPANRACVDVPRLNPPGLLAMNEVAAAINGNNQRIPSLWASLNYSATIKAEGQTHSVTSDDGVLLYMQPGFFRLNGKKEFVGTVFDMGINDTEFWLEIVPGAKELRWGSLKQLAREGVAGIPVDPRAVGEVLAVSLIGPNFLSTPVPAMHYEALSDSYVFDFNEQSTDHWFVQKQIWYDRLTLRPRRVMLYDVKGVPQLDARLSNDIRVQTPGAPMANWPMVAGDFHLFFPIDGSTMEFTLKDVRLYKQMPNDRHIPNRASFDRPEPEPDVRSIHVPISGNSVE